MAEPEKLFKVTIVTPDGIIYSHHSSIIGMRAIDGQREVMYNHLPILTPLAIGEVTVKRSVELDKRIDHIAVSGGYFEFSNNEATIIADSAERAKNVDLSRAEAAKQRAEKRMQNAQAENDRQSLARAQIALRRAVNRISVYNSEK